MSRPNRALFSPIPVRPLRWGAPLWVSLLILFVVSIACVSGLSAAIPPTAALPPTVTATPLAAIPPTATFWPTALPTPTLVPPTNTPAPTATPPPTQPPPTATPLPPTFNPPTVRFAVIGDFGFYGPTERAVAELVHSWNPDFVLTLGDNNYPSGSAKTLERNLEPYRDFIEQGRFYPILGNHDWYPGYPQPYIDFFNLPGNERYYDFAFGPVHIFALDSNYNEPDGIGPKSKQARWLQERLAAAREPWKIVALHHPPYSSGPHGSHPNRQWPFAAWGATAVLSGHDHTYERILRDGIVYFVNGLGGADAYAFEDVVQGSVKRYNAFYGAMLVEADAQHITFRFINTKGQVVDEYTITAP